MRSRIVGLLMVCCLLMSGRVLANVQELEVGMSRAEVIALLGEPSGRGSHGGREILLYGADQEIHLQDGVVYLVTGAEGVIQDRAQRVAEESQFAEPLVATESVRTWTEHSYSGPSFSFHMDEDAPVWALPALLAVFVFFIVISFAEMWCIFVKAGWPGWTCLVPIYNAYVMLKVAGMSGWWLLPPLIFFAGLVLPFRLAERFGKGAGFGVGLLILPILFYPILAFGSAEYQPL